MNTATIKARDTKSAPVRLVSDDDIGKIKKAMRAYQNFATLDEAVAAINKVATETDDFLGLPVKFRGIDVQDGKYVASPDAAGLYAGSYATFGYVAGSARGKEGKSIKMVLLFPTPTLDSVMDSEEAIDWLGKVANKELRHVLFRNFRDADSWDEIEQGFATAPTDLAGYLASHSRGAAEEIDTDTFDAIWPDYRKHLAKDRAALAKVLPAKQEVIKAIRSKSYADARYGDLEAKNIFLGIAMQIVQIAEGQDQPLDATAIKLWARERNATHIKANVVSEEDIAALETFDPTSAAAALGITG